MRVAKSGPRREPLVSKKGKARDAAAVEPVFEQVLQEERTEELDLTEALAEIDEYAERFKKNPSMQNLLRYKKKVRAFLQFLVKQSYAVEERVFYDPHGRRRLLMQVQTIDAKLEELTRSFLTKQDDSLDLLGRLDEIRGLLLDLYS
ncbi:MAG: YaaR family protein [Firmicutes bacterium]|nr:YaaR family protein [Bacillota bacterium]NLO66937.1 YaaR family protein [Bacillota bacterium]